MPAEERRVVLVHFTERPFCGGLLDNHRDGIYVCRLCGLPLFRSDGKFDSGTGWPSFFQPFDPQHVRELRGSSHGMIRIEIRCARCDGHLGHVFPDGPPPTGLRYCLNSVAMGFEGRDALHDESTPPSPCRSRAALRKALPAGFR